MDGLTNEFAKRSGLEFVDLLIEKKLMDGMDWLFQFKLKHVIEKS